MQQNQPPQSEFNFLHLSDIHFGDNEIGKQFDRDALLRDAVLKSLEILPAGVGKMDGILVTGDVAYSGAEKEYARADDWLGKLCERLGCSREAVYVIPGNHDVNRGIVPRNGSHWSAHQTVRNAPNDEERHKILKTQLKDLGVNPLAPFDAFNNFAQRYECTTSRDPLAWRHALEVPFSDGTGLVLHGLNSALISDADDVPDKLFLSEFQLAEVRPHPDAITLVLCHHPPNWLCDRTGVQDRFRKAAHVLLFGHEHVSRVDRVNDAVHVFAGAVHPERDAPGWKPCYNLLRLTISNSTAGGRELAVQLRSFEWSASGQAFVPESLTDGKTYHEIKLPLKAPVNPSTPASVTPAPSPPAMTTLTSTDPLPLGTRRMLIVHFFGLGVPLRVTITSGLSLWRDRDDEMKGHELWAHILKRAESEGRFHALWEAVATHDAELKQYRNPFPP